MRKVLSNRRCHEQLQFNFWGIDFAVGIGHEAGADGKKVGTIQELFINCGKSGNSMATMSRDAAVLISIALQHGAPVGVMRGAITRNEDGSPQGPIGHLLDLLADEEATA